MQRHDMTLADHWDVNLKHQFKQNIRSDGAYEIGLGDISTYIHPLMVNYKIYFFMTIYVKKKSLYISPFFGFYFICTM